MATETALIQIYHTVYENTKRKIISFAYFNKTYNNSRLLDIGTFVLKRNFLYVHFSDKLKPLRIGPFKIIKKIFDIAYEIVNQDGYTSHIHRNNLVPYYPKEPIIFPFIQQCNPYPNNDDNDNNDSNINDSIEPFDSFSDEEQSVKNEDHTFINSNKETDIPSAIDFQPQSFNQYSTFPYQQNKQKTNNTNPETQSIRNYSSSTATHSFQTLPEYTAYLNSDTDILDSSSSNYSPSAPYSPDRATITPNNTPILQTQISVIKTQSQNNTTTERQYTQQNLPF